MVSRRRISPILALASFALLAGNAHAAAQRTFVASNGNDANTAFNCSIVNPCRGFAAAVGVTTVNGEVVALDSAGYGAFTISQSTRRC